MLNHIRCLSITLMLLALTGCASGPTPQDIAGANYGSAIEQEAAENRVKQYFNGTLKDPYSAQFQFSKVEKGYIMTVNVNAKNSYGGYTGNQGYQFLFQNGLLVKGLKLHPSGIPTSLF